MLKKLPIGIIKRHGWYVYRPWDKVARKHAKQIKLAPEDAHLPEILDAYHRAIANKIINLRALIVKYEESPQFDSISKATQKGYRQCAIGIDKQKLNNRYSLLDISFDQWTPGLVRRYLDIREAKTQANREVQFMRSIFSWGYERDLCPNNPCKGVRLNKRAARTRYVTDIEFKVIFDKASPKIQLAMLLAWKCRLRRTEVLSLRQSHIEDGLLRCERIKGSRTTLVQIDEELQTGINNHTITSEIIELDPYLVHNGQGGKTISDSFSTEWHRLMAGFEPRFTFHDLKAKGISEDQGDKQRGSGHKSASMISVYDRKPSVVVPISRVKNKTECS